MSTTHYGLIGCGMMGQEHIRNIQLLENTSVSYILEPDAKMRAAAAKLAPAAKFVDSLEALLAIKELDCLVIVSPNYTHVSILDTIKKHTALPLLVEKPYFTDPNDLSTVKAFSKNYEAPIWIAMEYRYMPPVQTFLEQAEAITGGVTMLTIKEHRFPFLEKVNDWNRFNKNTGGTLVEKCCHYFDLMRLILNAEPVSIMASAGQAHNHLDEQYDGQTPDIWDHGYVIVNFDNGSKAMLELCMFAEGSRYQEEISALGSNGKIECLIPGPGRFWSEHLGAPPVPKVIVSPRNPAGPTEIDVPVDDQLLDAGDHNGSTFYQHQKFLNVVRGQGQPEVSADDGWKAVAMGIAAQHSATTGDVVKLDFSSH